MKSIGLWAVVLTLLFLVCIAIVRSALLFAIATFVGVVVLGIGILDIGWVLFLTLFLAYERRTVRRCITASAL